MCLQCNNFEINYLNDIQKIQMGNSKESRLSKTILEKYNIGMEEKFTTIEPISKPRTDWAKSFKEMRKNGHDELLIDDIFEDETKWE